ncbi:putative virus X resistance protein-like, coiled-coil [Helianthus annuus]|nr:putative virus X resistance protein-like, coiled-coil [Helianthus annuus]
MAESVLSVVLPLLIEKLVSETSNSIARYKGINAEIEKCQDSLKLIQRVLADASRKGITDDAVKGWLNDLQHLAYDIDDVLDGWATEAMHREFSHDSEGMTSKVRKLIPSCCTNFSPTIKMHDKLDRINAKLERLVKQRDDFGLTVGGETKPKNNNRRFQSSVVDPSSIVGRQAEKEALVQQLLLPAEEPCDRNYSIVPILGMGGVGKTTLARLLYNEEQVKNHFEVKAWVCVSDEFDSFRISNEMFQSLASEVKKEISNFNELQEALRDHLTGKRFLLVLDDVWSERREDWETLVRPFYTCAPGSKIIVTTRKGNLLKNIGYNPLNKQLESLSYDDALSLFAVHALGVRNFDSHVSLKPHGEGIVKKCNGLPLALIALGTSLRRKEDEDSWKEVLESEIWKLPDEDEIIPALRLSYHDLSGPLKQLFAYCSLFPKDFLFDKKELVLLWMAEGFLHHRTPSDSTEERLGHEFFDELLSRVGSTDIPNSLVELTLYGGSEDGVIISCSEFSHLLPSSLTSLDIFGFEKLESFSMGLQHLQSLSFVFCPNMKKVCSHPQRLTSLQHLTFSHCPKMTDLPEMLLPSLLSLNIWGDYPEGLKERCSKKGSYWPLISHIPCLDI